MRKKPALDLMTRRPNKKETVYAREGKMITTRRRKRDKDTADFQLPVGK